MFPQDRPEPPIPRRAKWPTAIASGQPIEFVYPSLTSIVPANVAMIKGGPNPEGARRFINYLLSDDGQRLLFKPDIARLRVQMRNELVKLQHQLGITTIYVTHDQEEALMLSTRIAVMNRGHLVQLGTPPDAFVADFLGGANFLPGTVASIGGEAVQMSLLREGGTGGTWGMLRLRNYLGWKDSDRRPSGRRPAAQGERVARRGKALRSKPSGVGRRHTR